MTLTKKHWTIIIVIVVVIIIWYCFIRKKTVVDSPKSTESESGYRKAGDGCTDAGGTISDCTSGSSGCNGSWAYSSDLGAWKCKISQALTSNTKPIRQR